jgi:hypothetical protein
MAGTNIYNKDQQ